MHPGGTFSINRIILIVLKARVHSDIKNVMSLGANNAADSNESIGVGAFKLAALDVFVRELIC